MDYSVWFLCFPRALYFMVCRLITDNNATIANDACFVEKSISYAMRYVIKYRLLRGIIRMPLFKSQRFMICSCIFYTLVVYLSIVLPRFF